MSYIVKTIKQEDDFEKKKLESILKKIFNWEGDHVIETLLKKFEEKGYVICKKIKI
jgi:hypothetical protein